MEKDLEVKKGNTQNFKGIITAAIVAVVAFIALEYNYTVERVECKKSTDECRLGRRNLLHKNTTNAIISYSDIKDVMSYRYIFHKTHRNANGRISMQKERLYGVKIIGNNGEESIIFENYTEKANADKEADGLLKAIKSDKDELTYTRQFE